MSGFDNRKSLSYRADAPSFSAVITPGTAVQTATITYKPTFKKGAPSITTTTMDQLQAALLRRDAGAKFYKVGADVGTLNATDKKALEAMRVDVAHTSDIAYRNACAKFGVPPQPRPARPALTTPQTAVPFLEQGAAWVAFIREHGELFQEGPFADQNIKVITDWFKDENRQTDAASLAQCYAECSAAGYFRDARILTRGRMDNSFRVIRPYNHAELVAARRQQAVAVTTAPPANWSDVDKEAWMAVRRDHPSLAVNSPAFQLCIRDTVQKWALEYVAEQHPDWFTQNPTTGQLETLANKRAEAYAAADRVLASWVRQSNRNVRIGGPGSRINLD
jgi:hypothetical protein